jgi:tight adherence protein C
MRGVGLLGVGVALAFALYFLTRSRARRTTTTVKPSGIEETPGGWKSCWSFAEMPLKLVPDSLRKRLCSDLEGQVAHSGMTVDRLTGLRVWATFALPFVVLFLLRFSRLGLMLAAPCAAFGWMLPVILASKNRDRYLDEVRRALPDTADMLYAFVLGGKNLDQAFRGAAEAAPEPLRSTLAQTVREMELGSTRAEAFEHLLERCPLPELASLLRTLLEAERRGHPLAGTLEVFSREIRLRRRDRLRVTVAKAPLKLLAPLVFLILPASVILTVGPTLLATLMHRF